MHTDVRAVYGAVKFDNSIFIKHCFMMIDDRVIDPTIFTHLYDGADEAEYIVCKSFTREEYIKALEGCNLDPNLYKYTKDEYLETHIKLRASGKVLAG